MRAGEWVSGGRLILVRAPDGAAMLWLDGEGELRDAIGIVRAFALDAYPASELELEELAVFVAEWLGHAAEHDATVAVAEIHPELRPCVREMSRSATI